MEIDQKTRDNLFTVIRAGMGLDASAIHLSEEECNSLLKIARRQTILSIVYRGLKQMGVSRSVLKDYDQFRLRTEYQAVQHDDALKRIRTIFDEEKIPYVLLKGAVLRHFYPDPVLRSSCDIDVLVHEEDIDKAVNALEEKTDFKKVKKLYHDISMVSSRVHLELHFSIKEDMENIDPLLSKVWDYTHATGDGIQYALTPEFQIFHVVAHMSYHMTHGGLGIRPFLDLWLLRAKTQYNESSLKEMCSNCNLLTFYERSCKMADSWMNGEVVDTSLRDFEIFCLNGGVFGTSETVLVSKQRTKRGARYFWGRVFMSRSNLEKEFPELKEKPYLLLNCQIRRWNRLLKQSKRNQVRRELKEMRKLDSDTIASYDNLLKSLGL